MMVIFFSKKGYTDSVKGLVRLGLLSPDPHPYLHEQVCKKSYFPKKYFL